MELELYQWNGNKLRLEKPSLQEILGFEQPFAITLPLKKDQRVPDEIVMGNWNCPWFSTWSGIRILNYSPKITYLLSQFDYQDGERKFESKSDIIIEWSTDKYRSRANWYKFRGQYPNEIFDEFRKLGFLFDSNAP